MLIWVCSHFSAPKYAEGNIGKGEGAHLSENKDVKSECKKFGKNFKFFFIIHAATSDGSMLSLNRTSGGHCSDTASGISMRMLIYICHNKTGLNVFMNNKRSRESVK